MSYISPKLILKGLDKIQALNNIYMDVNTDMSDEEEDRLLRQIDNEISIVSTMIQQFTYNKVDANTAEKMVRFHLDKLKSILEGHV